MIKLNSNLLSVPMISEIATPFVSVPTQVISWSKAARDRCQKAWDSDAGVRDRKAIDKYSSAAFYVTKNLVLPRAGKAAIEMARGAINMGRAFRFFTGELVSEWEFQVHSHELLESLSRPEMAQLCNEASVALSAARKSPCMPTEDVVQGLSEAVNDPVNVIDLGLPYQENLEQMTKPTLRKILEEKSGMSISSKMNKPTLIKRLMKYYLTETTESRSSR